MHIPDAFAPSLLVGPPRSGGGPCHGRRCKPLLSKVCSRRLLRRSGEKPLLPRVVRESRLRRTKGLTNLERRDVWQACSAPAGRARFFDSSRDHAPQPQSDRGRLPELNLSDDSMHEAERASFDLHRGRPLLRRPCSHPLRDSHNPHSTSCARSPRASCASPSRDPGSVLLSAGRVEVAATSSTR